MFVALPLASSGVDVYFATQVATLRRLNRRLMWTTWLPFGLFCRTYWKHLPLVLAHFLH